MIVNQRGGKAAGPFRGAKTGASVPSQRGTGTATIKRVDRGPRPDPRMDYNPREWTSQPDVLFHSSHSPQMPKEGDPGGIGYGPGFHIGTITAAEDRGWNATSGLGRERAFIHPVQVTGQTALRPDEITYNDEGKRPTGWPAEAHKLDPGSDKHPLSYGDWDANYTPGTLRVLAGENVPYVNFHENKGAVSLRAPRENLHTWSEAVLSDPGASAKHRHLARQFDVTIPVGENTRPSRFAGTPAGLVPRPMKFTSVLKSKKSRTE